MRALFLFLLLASSFAAAETPYPCSDQPDAVSLAAVVQIHNANGELSSGVVIAKNRIVTVAHAVDSASHITVAGARHKATVIKTDLRHDLALLAVATPSLPILTLSSRPGASEQRLWAVGYPLGLQQHTSTGRLQHQSPDHLYASVPINNGTSGGSLLSCEGGRFVLAGIVRGYLAYDDGQDLINTGNSVSVPTTALRRFLQPDQDAARVTERF